MTKTIGTGDHKDFDEARRLLYMAHIAHGTKKYNLAGTLTNALKHHHAVDLPLEEIMANVIGVLEPDACPDKACADSHRAWVMAQIERITAELGD